MRKVIYAIALVLFCFIVPTPVLAQTTVPEVSSFTTEALNIITLVSAAAAVFFLIRGGYIYITSTGKPEALDEAKKTIKNALIGLVIILAANLIVNVFTQSLTGGTDETPLSSLNISQVEAVKPSNGLTQVLIDAINGFLQNVVESATKPVVDGILGFLTTTPQLLLIYHRSLERKFKFGGKLLLVKKLDGLWMLGRLRSLNNIIVPSL
jgi:hypothetical protein